MSAVVIIAHASAGRPAAACDSVPRRFSFVVLRGMLGSDYDRVLPASVANGAALCGVATAVFVLAGRWGLGRLLGFRSESVLFELRTLALIVAVAAIVWPLRIGLGGQVGPSRVRPFAAETSLGLALLLGYLMLSAVWSYQADAGLVKATDVGMVFIALTCSYWFLSGERAHDFVATFWATVLVLGAALALLGLRASLSAPGRLAVLGGGPNVYGRIMGLFAMACLFYVSRARLLILLPGLAVGAALLVLTGSRGALLGFAAALAAFLVVGRVRIRYVVGTAVLAVGIGAMVLALTPLGQMVVRVFRTRFIALLVDRVHLSGRGVLFETAWQMGIQDPVFGAGLGAYRVSGDQFTYPHNVLLELFAEAGIVAVLLASAVTFFVLVRLVRRRDQLDSATLGALVLIATASQVSGDLYDTRALPLLALIAVSPGFSRFSKRVRPVRVMGNPAPGWVRSGEHGG